MPRSNRRAADTDSMDKELEILTGGATWGIVEWEEELYGAVFDKGGTTSCPLTEDVDMRTGIKMIVDVATPEVLQAIIKALQPFSGPAYVVGNQGGAS
jgi:hypothetical protein